MYRVKLDWSNEEQKEHARIATTFVVKSFVRHQKMQKDLADKIWLMGEAAMALPEELQAAAAEIDIECPPPDRPWPVWATPPIKGFDTSPFEDVDDDDDDEQDKMLS